jgi:3-oxoacyl-[acyl-carrier-protein] synthase III
MTSQQAVGIYAVGVYLPETVRKNDWWPEAVRTKWKERAESFQPDTTPPAMPMTDGVAAVLKAIAETRGDPFSGSTERRVIAKNQVPSDMETLAAQDAIKRAGIDPGEIDLVLGGTLLPDYLFTPNACAVHRNLGLRHDCLTVAIDNNACNSFLLQLELAQALMRTGRAHLALLMQSCWGTIVAAPESPQSAWFGDGASAVIVGPVSEGRGILSAAHRTDGRFRDSLVGGVPGGRWYEGKFQWYPLDRDLAKEMILGVADCGREVVHAALAQAGHTPAEVDYYACHQATPWFGRVTRAHAGLTKARHLDTYSWTTGLSAVNVPIQMATGEREGLLLPGDLVATYAGGSGITYSSVVLRWGR